MFGTALNPTFLIEEQWIAKEYVETDLLFLGRLDSDFVGGYKPHIIEMSTLRDILWDDLSITDLVDTPANIGSAGQILEVDPTGQFLIWADPIDDFLDLLDTPSNYTGFAGFNVSVNSTETGLEFTPPFIPTPHYEARVLFGGAVNPTINQQFSSNLGVTVTWQRTSVGVFEAVFSAPVNANNLIAYIGNSSTGRFTIGSYNATNIQFIHQDFAGLLSDPTSIIAVEIKLYP
jgi:hypothetical protein